MPPLNNIEVWGRRSDLGEPIEPRRRLYLLYEGEHTERLYFSSLVALLNRKGLPKYLADSRCDRTGDDEGSSNPKSLLGLAKTVMGEDASPRKMRSQLCLTRTSSAMIPPAISSFCEAARVSAWTHT